MKRAAILLIAIATLVLIGYPSAPSLADSSNSVVKGKSSSSAVIAVPGGTVLTGTGDTGGGSNEGDADGLSGLKGRPPIATLDASGTGVTRVMVMLETWWKFMLWSR